MSVINTIYHPEINNSILRYEYVCSNGVRRFYSFANSTNKCICVPFVYNDLYEQIGFNNAFVMLIFGLITMLLLILLISFLLYEKSLHTPFGINCLLLCIFDAILITAIILGEVPIYISRYLFSQLQKSYADNPANGMEADNLFVFIVRFVQAVSQYQTETVFLIFSLRMITFLLRLIKTASRFAALYFPWRIIFTIKNMFHLCLLSTLVSLFIFAPLVVLPKKCQVEINSYIFAYITYCGLGYYYFNNAFEICVALICTLLDIASFIKLRRSKPASNGVDLRRKQEIMMLIQNCTNLSVFVVSIFPLMLIVFLPRWIPCFTLYPMGAIVYMVHLNSIKIVIGHGLDTFISMILLYRLAKYNRVQAKHIQIIVNSEGRKRSSIYPKEDFLKRKFS